MHTVVFCNEHMQDIMTKTVKIYAQFPLLLSQEKVYCYCLECLSLVFDINTHDDPARYYVPQ